MSDYLFCAAMNDPENSGWKHDARRGARIEAIKLFRQKYGCSLYAAKTRVDEYISKNNAKIGQNDRVLQLYRGAELYIVEKSPGVFEVKKKTIQNIGTYCADDLYQVIANIATDEARV